MSAGFSVLGLPTKEFGSKQGGLAAASRKLLSKTDSMLLLRHDSTWIPVSGSRVVNPKPSKQTHSLI